MTITICFGVIEELYINSLMTAFAPKAVMFDTLIYNISLIK